MILYTSMKNYEHAVRELKRGNIILIYDGDEREGEADLVVPAAFITHKHIYKMRKEAGGLICVALSAEKSKILGLPFFVDIVEASKEMIPDIGCKKTAYGDKPAFSLPVNSNQVYTGITDKDRAITIKELSGINSKVDFCEKFYTPGHVFLLISRGIENRKGHTELSTELGKRAGFDSMVLCEMLGNGSALSKQKAKEYAKKHKLVFIEGKEIVDAL